MIVLAIDSASAVGGVGLVSVDRLLASAELGPAGGQAERTLAALDELLQGAGLAPSDIDLVVVAAGPGSFTGLRVGMAAGQGFALGIGKPVVSVPSTSVLALWAREVREGMGALWCGVVNARRGDVFLGAAVDHPGDAGDLEGRFAPAAVRLDELWEALDPVLEGLAPGGPVVFCGDGVPVLAPVLVHGRRSVVTVSPPRPPDAVTAVARLGRRQFLREGAPALLEPLYLRAPDARKPGAPR